MNTTKLLMGYVGLVLFLIILVMYKMLLGVPLIRFNYTNVILDEAFINIPEDPSKYVVYTKGCRILKVNPFNQILRKQFKPHKYETCQNREPIVEVFYNETQKFYRLYINSERVAKVMKENKLKTNDRVTCCYRNVSFLSTVKKSDSYAISNCIDFEHNDEVPRNIDDMIINCKSVETQKVLQEHGVFLVQYKNRSKIRQSSERVPSVLIIGLDSVSRTNFVRNMPKTAAYIKRSGWFDLLGYNVVGRRTFANLMPLLLGGTEERVRQYCHVSLVGGIDKCTFIWDLYSKLGYHTAYIEDVPLISTFNYLKPGFNNKPTNYYFRPLSMAMWKHLKFQTVRDKEPFCIGFKQWGEYVMEYARQFANVYRNEPTFGFFWINSFTHASYDRLSAMDEKFVDYFETLKSDGILENNILIFISDHGRPHGVLFRTREGYFEARSPMFFIALPKWYQQQHADFVNALRINKHRLTTPFDIHMTLKHLLTLHNPIRNIASKRFSDCTLSQSIFLEIPDNRTCQSACIPDNWCGCSLYETVSAESKTTDRIIQLILQKMNEYLIKKNLSNLCHKFKLKKLLQTNLKITNNDVIISRMPQTNLTYRVNFETSPCKAEFEAFLTYDTLNDGIAMNVEEITRVDSYRSTGKCVYTRILKNLCICK